MQRNRPATCAAVAGSGDKSRWTGALEQALLDGAIDVAVHSAKDVPGELAPGTAIVAVPPRADPRDVLVGARVARRAARRRPGRHERAAPARAAARRPAGPRRGRAARERRHAAAQARRRRGRRARARRGRPRAAGARRRAARAALEGDVFVPAPGQGCLALQARTGARFDAVDDPAAHAALDAERAVVARLDASCHTPVGVHHGPSGLRAFVGLPDGSEWLIDDAPDAAALAERMLAAGAAGLLARAEAMA